MLIEGAAPNQPAMPIGQNQRDNNMLSWLPHMKAGNLSESERI